MQGKIIKGIAGFMMWRPGTPSIGAGQKEFSAIRR